MQREIDKSTRPTPSYGETLDAYIDRYLTWLENELVAITNDRLRRAARRNKQQQTRPSAAETTRRTKSRSSRARTPHGEPQ